MAELITARQVSALLNIPLPTVYRYAQRGVLPAVRIGGNWRFRKDVIESRWLSEAVHSANVLVVYGAESEAEQEARELIAKTLTQEGHKPWVVGTGEEALAAVAAQTFELIFLDLQLSGKIKGVDVLRHLAADFPTTRVVIVTDLPESRALRKVAGIGVTLLMAKPPQAEQVRSTIRSVLSPAS